MIFRGPDIIRLIMPLQEGSRTRAVKGRTMKGTFSSALSLIYARLVDAHMYISDSERVQIRCGAASSEQALQNLHGHQALQTVFICIWEMG